jgi:hypothetical protein
MSESLLVYAMRETIETRDMREKEKVDDSIHTTSLWTKGNSLAVLIVERFMVMISLIIQGHVSSYFLVTLKAAGKDAMLMPDASVLLNGKSACQCLC